MGSKRIWGHTLSTISMNAWASCPERFSTVLTSLASEKIVAIRATCSSTVRVLLINCFQTGVFERSAVRQKGNLRMESQASPMGGLTWCTPRNIFGLLFQIKRSLASRQVLARPRNTPLFCRLDPSAWFFGPCGGSH